MNKVLLLLAVALVACNTAPVIVSERSASLPNLSNDTSFIAVKVGCNDSLFIQYGDSVFVPHWVNEGVAIAVVIDSEFTDRGFQIIAYPGGGYVEPTPYYQLVEMCQ